MYKKYYKARHGVVSQWSSSNPWPINSHVKSKTRQDRVVFLKETRAAFIPSAGTTYPNRRCEDSERDQLTTPMRHPDDC